MTVDRLSLSSQAYDLGSTLMIITFFTFLFGLFLTSLLSAKLRFRCYDTHEGVFYESPYLVCSSIQSIGRQCTRANATCVDSGTGEHASLRTGGRDILALTPYYERKGLSADEVKPITWYANPPYQPSFDNFPLAVLSVFQIWCGVDWSIMQNLVVDTQGAAWESVFIIMYAIGSWVLMNVFIAVLGTAYEREKLHQLQRLKRREADATHVLDWLSYDRLKENFDRYLRPTLRDHRIVARIKSIITGLPIPKDPRATAQINGRRLPTPKDAKGEVRHIKNVAKEAEAGILEAVGSLKKAFETIDKNGDGLLTEEELEDAYERLHLTMDKQQFLSFIDACDKDGSGEISFNEFVAVLGLSGPRLKLRKVLVSASFRALAFFVVLANAVVSAFDGPFVDERFGRGDEAYRIWIIGHLFGIYFLLEMLLRIYVFGLRTYATTPSFVFEGLLVVVWFFEVISWFTGLELENQVLSSLKSFRLLRLHKLLYSLSELSGTTALLDQIYASLVAVAWMLVALVIWIFLIAILGMHLYSGMYDDVYAGGRCLPYADGANSTQLHTDSCALKPRHHFDFLLISIVSVFQTVTQDVWSRVMWDTYLVSGPLAFIFFPAVVISGNFVMVNMFLSILLSTFSSMAKQIASKVNQETAARLAQEEEQQRKDRHALKAQRDADVKAARFSHSSGSYAQNTDTQILRIKGPDDSGRQPPKRDSTKAPARPPPLNRKARLRKETKEEARKLADLEARRTRSPSPSSGSGRWSPLARGQRSPTLDAATGRMDVGGTWVAPKEENLKQRDSLQARLDERAPSRNSLDDGEPKRNIEEDGDADDGDADDRGVIEAHDAVVASGAAPPRLPHWAKLPHGVKGNEPFGPWARSLFRLLPPFVRVQISDRGWVRTEQRRYLSAQKKKWMRRCKGESMCADPQHACAHYGARCSPQVQRGAHSAQVASLAHAHARFRLWITQRVGDRVL